MERSNYILYKIGFAVITLLAVLLFNFVLFRILPGDPIKLIIHSPRMTREAQDRIRASFGLDKPVWLDVQRLEKQGHQQKRNDNEQTGFQRASEAL
jgi:ABC-type dipeptide/oligopeptide/nickel transport system permease component